MTEKRFTYKHFDWLQWHIYKDGEFFIEVTNCEEDAKKLCELLNMLHEEVMNNRAEITRFKLVVSDIVEDLEKQAKSKEPIIISMDYVDWIKKEVDLRLNSQKGD